MRKLLTFTFAVLLIFSLVACGGQTAKSAGSSKVFSVGYAKADITPDHSVPLVGFNDIEERWSNQIMDRLYATCVAFTDAEDNTVLVISFDGHNSAPKLHEELRQKISDATGVPFSHILFTASHTHSGPDQFHPAIGAEKKSNDNYSEKCLQAAQEALADRKPAKMYGAFTRPEGLNYVRHYVLTNGDYQGKAVGTLPDEQIYGHVWKADNLLQLIKFVREGGKDVVLINWQAHYHGATQINYYGISADYPGVLRSELESRLDCNAAFILGGAGSLSCTSQIPGETKADTYIEHGKLLADEAEKAAESFQPLETGTIILKENLFVVPGTAKQNPLYTFGFGDFGMAFAPWEIFDDHAMAVRENSNYTFTFYASCANAGSGNSYLPNKKSFDYYSYEAGATKYPIGTGELIRDTLTEMINDCFSQSGQTVKQRPEGYVTQSFKPYTDGIVYTNPSVGDLSALQESAMKHYPLMLVSSAGPKNVVIETKELAEQLIGMESFKLLFDERNIVVGIAE